ncbi:MAG: GerMN domain-containing protein [Proteobacteria bacterium]|nr:GerMN domain-containing protein [Pseudomonadota bacterium]
MTKKTLRNSLWAILALCACVVIVVYMVGGDRAEMDDMGVPPGNSNRYTVESPVYLYFQDRKLALLCPEERLIAHPETPVEFARTIIEWLIRGPRQGLVRTLPGESVLRALYIHEETAFVDLSQETCDNHPGGVQTEYLTIVSIANSLILNIPEIKRVKIIIEGRECETLAGHIDISQPFSANMLLVR